MNIKLSNEDKRRDVLVHIREISELDICLFVDTGFDKMGNMSMENSWRKWAIVGSVLQGRERMAGSDSC